MHVLLCYTTAELRKDPNIDKLFEEAEKSTAEPATQALYVRLATVANRLAQPDLFVCNTSAGGYPGNEKIDITLSKIPKPKKKQGSVSAPYNQLAGCNWMQL
jgi:hypothetical protein